MNNDKKMFGVLRQWDAARGFGFIKTINEDKSVTTYFLHLSKVESGVPRIGSAVRFNVGRYDKGTAMPAVDAAVGDVIPKFNPPVSAKSVEVKS